MKNPELFASDRESDTEPADFQVLTDGHSEGGAMNEDLEQRDESSSLRADRDRGFSLVEIILTISLMTITILPLLLAASTAVTASSSARTGSKVESVLNNAADRVNRAPELCDYTIYLQAAALAQGWPASSVSATYQWYQPAANPTVAGTWNSGACPGGVRTDELVQLVTITVTSPDSRITRTIQVVKSDV